MNDGESEPQLEKIPKNIVLPGHGLVVFESRRVAGFSATVKDAASKFYLVISGHSRWEGEGRRYFLGPDTLIFIPSGQAHSQVDLPNDPVTVYGVHYRPELLTSALASQLTALGMLALDLGSANVNQARVVRSIFQEMLFEQGAGQEGWEMMLQSRLIDLAVRALRLVRRRGRNDLPAFEPGNDSTERVARYALTLKSRFFRQETITEAARSVGLGRRQFTDLFRKVTGQSWRRYVLGLRLNHAASLLAETERSVVAVAFESGFDDLSYFNHSFKDAYGCSPLAYREQRQVRLANSAGKESSRASEASTGFKLRGIKGWFWTEEQYLEEIPILPSLKMNFLMDCYGSFILSQPPLEPGKTGTNEWWKPIPEGRKQAYARIIQSCHKHDIQFCFALHPQLASPRPLNPENAEDVENFFQHYAWAQSLGVRWFSVCMDDTGWGTGGPKASGLAHARLVNTIFGRLRERDESAQFAFCPVICWGDATNPEHRDYLEALAGEMHAEAYVFWNGDSIVTPRITRVAAESFKRVVNHRLFLWDNYPVNDGSPTLHLGPVSGRDAGLCEVVDGYLSNPMHTQNQINRVPLATCADYAFNPGEYNPARSVGQAILRVAKTAEQQRVIKELVEAYPGFIVAGGGTGTNSVRAKFGTLLAAQDSKSAAQKFVHHLEDILKRLAKFFPEQFKSTRKTVSDDIAWMKKHTGERVR